MSESQNLPARPVQLQINNSGAWKLLGRFDAADDEQTSLVLDAAEELMKTLHNSGDPKGCPTMPCGARRR